MTSANLSQIEIDSQDLNNSANAFCSPKTSNIESSPKSKTKFKIIPKEIRDQIWALHFNEEHSDLLALTEYLIEVCEPDFDFYFLAGVSCRKLSKYQDAMGFLHKALELDPDNYAANFEVAEVFCASDLSDLAEKTFVVCSEMEPHNIDPLFRRAEILYEKKDYQTAESLLIKANQISPDVSYVLDLLVMCLISSAQYRKAYNQINYMLKNKVGTKKSFSQICHANLLTVSSELGLFEGLEKSINEVEKLISVYAENPEKNSKPRFNLATTYLRMGQTEKGWSHYFHRYDRSDFPSAHRKFMKPRVTSLKELRNKTVLLWREQGVGDEIMALGLIEEFKRKSGANIIFESDKRLVDCIRNSLHKVKVEPESYDKVTLLSERDDFDYHMPLMDVLVFLNIDESVQHTIVPWLKIDPAKQKFWQHKITTNDMKIGFALSSHFHTPKRDKHKHLDLKFLADLIKGSNHTWINFDYTLNEQNTSELSKEVTKNIYFPEIDLRDDFVQTSALLSTCDILISPNMAIRSLAGAVGTRNASFNRGMPHQFDLGAWFHNQSPHVSPMIPFSSVIQLDDEIDEQQFYRSLNDHFKNEIEKARSTKHGVGGQKLG